MTSAVLRCSQHFIGQTTTNLQERFSKHRSYVDRDMEATGTHFNLPGHSNSGMIVTIVIFMKKRHSKDVWTREVVESKHLRKSKKVYKGINQKP